ncbi:hypothetical protein [Salibacterium sp. K-3]
MNNNLFAEELNFPFSKDDWETFQQETLQEMTQSSELRENQVEAVAGGHGGHSVSQSYSTSDTDFVECGDKNISYGANGIDFVPCG